MGVHWVWERKGGIVFLEGPPWAWALVATVVVVTVFYLGYWYGRTAAAQIGSPPTS